MAWFVSLLSFTLYQIDLGHGISLSMEVSMVAIIAAKGVIERAVL